MDVTSGWYRIGYDIPPSGSWLDLHAPRIVRGVEELAFEPGHHAGYLTLTHGRPVDNIEATAAQDELVRRMRRQQERESPRLGRLEYVSIREVTGRNWVHANLIVAPWSYIHYTWLCREWRRITGAYMLSVGAITTPRGLLSYLSKEPQELPTTWGFRRICFSQGWPGAGAR